jgi:hypothetical protein
MGVANGIHRNHLENVAPRIRMSDERIMMPAEIPPRKR